MFEKIKSYLLPVLIALSALSVSASAAFYSVSGLSKLFAGATLAVIIMATSLEVAKLVTASLLYQYWSKLNKLLRIYLTIAASVLILITSIGIYGFLSAAYQETASKAGNIEAQVTLVETKRDNIKSQLEVYNTEKTNIDKAVSDLRAGLSNNVIQYTDKNGNVVTTTSSATRKALEKQLDQAIIRQTDLNSKVDILNEQLFGYETEIVEISTDPELAGELGPLKYLSNLTGVSMDRIINWLLLVIIFVFDPLAIALVIAANFAFAQLRPKKDDVLHPNPQVEPENLNIEHNKEDQFSDFIPEEEWEVEDEWDDDHALSEVLNSMVEEIEEEEDIIKDLDDVDVDLLADYVKWDQGIDWDEEIESNLSLSEKQRLEAKYDQIKRLDHMNNYDQNQRLYNIRQQINKLNSKKNDNDLTINY